MATIHKGDTVLWHHWSGMNHRVLVHRVHRDKTLTVTCPAALDSTPLMRISRSELVPEVVPVHVTLEWGKVFNGEYLAPTPGVGCYVTVMEDSHGPSIDRGPGFHGCPLGSGASLDQALDDFVGRGRYEYRGLKSLTRDMLSVVRTDDYRRPVGA